MNSFPDNLGKVLSLKLTEIIQKLKEVEGLVTDVKELAKSLTPESEAAKVVGNAIRLELLVEGATEKAFFTHRYLQNEFNCDSEGGEA